ncbi:pyridoxal phosphate-dependent aminotransferase [Rhizobium gallicum]|uniref:pyridoxal phosphate-dependent aminotransferase n=1 Tax=Rhizobium gallicum TaxID=56730 RepID=UPI001EF8119F|nr:pyridoxal phosphate-dependent aminotransferase [Rhizobium gallicum]ULJ74327.1 pyridoxal phosphate-dependent aminotransferase [Rhizobium gallicum]
MSLIAKRLQAVRPSQTKAMTAAAAVLKEKGIDVIALSQGEPDFDTPEPVQNAGIAAIRNGKTRYTPVAGVKPLRVAIQQKLLRDNGLDYDVDQITVGCGAKQIVFNALFASLDPGDAVIIPAPCWVSYPDMVQLAGGEPVLVPSHEHFGFKLKPQDLEAAITPRTKWLMLNSPNNPTGAVYSKAELAALAEVLRKHKNVQVLSDDIYEKLVYGVRFATMAEAAPDLIDRVLTVNGVSKSSAMTGWRLGYGAGPKDLIKAMNTIEGQTSSHTSSISQYAAIEAIAGDQSYVGTFVSEFRKRRDFVVERINEAEGLKCRTPDGAFYVFVNCAGVIGKVTPQGTVIADDMDFAMYLLEHFGVAVVPGSAFMASPYIRISYAASIEELQQACGRILAACEALSEGEKTYEQSKATA